MVLMLEWIKIGEGKVKIIAKQKKDIWLFEKTHVRNKTQTADYHYFMP